MTEEQSPKPEGENLTPSTENQKPNQTNSETGTPLPPSKEAPKTPVSSTPPSPAKPVPKTPTARPAPPRPTVVRGAPTSESRRHFIFTWLGLAWTAFAFATGAALTTCLRFLYPNVLFEPKMNFKIGKPEEYEIGKVDLRWKDQFGVWIVRTFEGMYALSTVCTHLGCPPSWLETEQKFKCPCHGSGFYKSGINFEGPAPRPLERYRMVLADDGQVVVDKSKKFQQEKGEWDQPEAFLVV